LPWRFGNGTPHDFHETLEKDHGRIEHRRCYAFDQLDGLHRPERWPDLKSFVVIESSRSVKDKTTTEQRFYISSLPPEAAPSPPPSASTGTSRIASIGAWMSSSPTIGCAPAPEHAAHNLAILKQLTLNLLRLNPAPRKGGIKVHRLIASASDSFRSQILAFA
jgi:hypothetical protein